MPLTPPFREIPKTAAEWERYFRQVNLTAGDVGETQIADNSVTNAKLRNSVGTSVIGQASSSTTDPADIVATADNQLLMRRSSALQWDTLGDSDIPAAIARDSEVTAAVAAEATARDAAIAAKFATGTFTGTLTGVSGTATGTLRYDISGQIASLYIPAITDTSNATTMTITGAPAAIFPTRAQVSLAIVKDNGTDQLGMVQIETSGVLTFSADVAGAAFTNTGSKGVGLQTLAYMLS